MTRVNVLKRWSCSKLIGVGGAWFALTGGAFTAQPPAAAAEPEPEVTADKGAFLERTVELPRYVVSAIRIDKNPWRYAAVPGFEILSRASDHDTSWVLHALQLGRWTEDKVLPADWRPRSPVPYTVIIDNTNLAAVGRAELHADPLTFNSPADAFAWGLPPQDVKVWTDRFAARDADTFALNVNVYDAELRGLGYGSISLERQERCAPPLPRWLMYGLEGKRFGLFRNGFMPQNIMAVFRVSGNTRLVGPGTLWISIEETKRLQKEFKAAKHKRKNGELAVAATIPFIPLDRLFTEPPPEDETSAQWESEAALFVRWGLFDSQQKDPATRQAFVRFVERARRERVTEPMFTECFGRGYAAMERTLREYLTRVLAQPLTIDLDYPSDLPEPWLSQATADQIGRILGDWLRLQGRNLRRQDPALAAKFLGAAGRMLMRAYQIDNGLPPDAAPAAPRAAGAPGVVLQPFVVSAERVHDPGLLATFGLYEHDVGDDAKARPFLEKAVETGVARPQARVVLSELRYAEAIAHPAGSDGRITKPQAEHILAPLRSVLPEGATIESYGLIVETWAHGEAGPSDLDVKLMVEGVSRYPQSPILAFRAAAICAQSGRFATARQIIDQGLVFVTDARTQARFEQLRAQVAESR